jgi:hypothetical protein
MAATGLPVIWWGHGKRCAPQVWGRRMSTLIVHLCRHNAFQSRRRVCNKGLNSWVVSQVCGLQHRKLGYTRCHGQEIVHAKSFAEVEKQSSFQSRRRVCNKGLNSWVVSQVCGLQHRKLGYTRCHGQEIVHAKSFAEVGVFDPWRRRARRCVA